MKLKLLLYILLTSFYFEAFSQQTNAFFYINDQQPGREEVYNKVQEIISKNDADKKAVYISYKEQEVFQVGASTKIEEKLSSSAPYEKSVYAQLSDVAQWMNENDWMSNLNTKSNSDVLVKNLELHFFFNSEDFFNYEEYKTIIDYLLNINRLNTFKNGEKVLHENCSVFIYLRDDGFLKSSVFSNRYQKIYQDLIKPSNYKLDSY